MNSHYESESDKKGFTLIELMIAIAIIGILAAIAVPQFQSYKIRAINSAGKAVAHNLRADQANLYSETSQYGELSRVAVNLATIVTPGVVETHSAANAALAIPATATQTGGALGNSRVTVAVALGKDMIGLCLIDATGQSYTAYTRHYKGDTAYGVDSDIESVLYVVSNPTWPGSVNIGASTPVSTKSNDDISAQNGNGLPGTSWRKVSGI